MNPFVFSQQTGKSYYCNSIAGFLHDQPSFILGELTKYAAKYGFSTVVDQSNAWENQIDALQAKLKASGCKGDIIFEYDIVRMGKRIDVVLLIKHMVFSLEFKNGAKSYVARDAEQAEDYALNLKNFHRESENLYVCPILVATEAPSRPNTISSYPDKQVRLQYANQQSLMECIRNVYEVFGTDEEIDVSAWYNSPYCPTPTIIEAAVTAYRDHTVEKIAHSEAGQDDIDACEEEIQKIVEETKGNGGKSIIFVTGVPGAGKTLVGLDLASKNLSVEENTKAVYLSGNGPLVSVLRKALVLNTVERAKELAKTKKTPFGKDERKQIDVAVSMFIQEAYNFRKDNVLHSDQEPAENVVIFDEAQRCWNKPKLVDWTKKKFGIQIDASEPQYFISIMDRRKDWSVIVCLVGLGQDIYDGEIGINEWFRSAIQDFSDWNLYYSPSIFEQIEDGNIDKELILSCGRAHQCEHLHLTTSIRSFRSERQSEFVDCLLANEPAKARAIYEEIKKQYPIFITRDFKLAKRVTQGKVRGSQRSGVIACSSAQRLKPEGIFVPTEIDVNNWFLAPKEDLRSSNALEVVASEFKVQGLEIDYSIVCWDADLRREKGGWGYYSFRGTSWNKRHKEEQRRYLLNAYRVLLTRARQSMIIYIPYGDDTGLDPTRNPKYYEDIFEYLHKECGIELLPED